MNGSLVRFVFILDGLTFSASGYTFLTPRGAVWIPWNLIFIPWKLSHVKSIQCSHGLAFGECHIGVNSSLPSDCLELPSVHSGADWALQASSYAVCLKGFDHSASAYSRFLVDISTLFLNVWLSYLNLGLASGFSCTIDLNWGGWSSLSRNLLSSVAACSLVKKMGKGAPPGKSLVRGVAQSLLRDWEK